jgi:hypothetical protein
LGVCRDRDGSVTIKRTGHYSVDYELVPLELVAGKTRTMPDEFIAASGHDVTDAFRQYLRPLLGSGMPDAYRLRPNKVPKILAAIRGGDAQRYPRPVSIAMLRASQRGMVKMCGAQKRIAVF